jgi:hypothetical protein
MLRIEPRLALINGVLLANRVLIFRFQLLTVYVLLVHNCGECRIRLVKFHQAPHIVGHLYGVPHGILRVSINVLYENVFQNHPISRAIFFLDGKKNHSYNVCIVFFLLCTNDQLLFL